MQRYFTALESEEVLIEGEDIALAEGRELEESLVRSDDAQASEFQDAETVQAVMESLHLLADEAKALSNKPGVANATTLALLQMGAQQQLNRLGVKFKTVSLESDDPNKACDQHQVAAEAFKDVANHIGSYYVVNSKIKWDFFADLFKSTEEMVGKYEVRLAEARHEWEQRDKGTIKASQISPLVGVWQFFCRDNQVVLDPPSELAKDVELTKFVLVEYPKRVLAQLHKLTSVLEQHSRVTRVEDVVAVANGVQGVTAPSELFDPAVLKGHYLNSTTLEVIHGTSRSGVSLGGRDFKALAELATPSYVRESTQIIHQFNQVIRNIPIVPLATGTVAMMELLLFWGTKIKTEDIVKLYDHGDEYLIAVRSFLAQRHAMERGIQAFNAASEKFTRAVEEAKISGAKSVVAQINQLGKNFERCLESPGAAEVSRALKAARFAAYLGRRLTAGSH
ncbi:hypothetical protein D3C71_77810 [compost metagenome]